MTPWLSVVVPTINRPTLARTLSSILWQPQGGDVEVLVVEDTYQQSQPSMARDVAYAFGPRVRYLAHDGGQHCSGHPQRNAAMPQARGDWLAFLDDDDAWTPEALASIRLGLNAEPDRVLIYRMQYADGAVLWREPRVRCGNVGTPMIVVPNEPGRLGAWGHRYEGDCDFLVSTLERRNEEPAWHPEVVALVRPA